MRPSILFFLSLTVMSYALQVKPRNNDERTDTRKTPTAKQSTQQSTASESHDAPPDAQYSSKQTTQEQGDSANRVYRINIVSEPTSGWTVAYVVISGLLGAISLGTLVILWRQTNVSHNAERARLDIIFELFGDPETPTFQFNVDNSGRSAAHVMDYTLYHESVPRNNDVYTEPGSKTPVVISEFRNAILHKEKGATLRSLSSHTVFSKEERAGNCVTGVVKYIDIFNKRHQTRIVYKFDSGALMYLPKYAKYQ